MKKSEIALTFISIIINEYNKINNENVQSIANIDKNENLIIRIKRNNMELEVKITEQKNDYVISLIRPGNDNISIVDILISKTKKMENDQRNINDVITYNYGDNLKYLYKTFLKPEERNKRA